MSKAETASRLRGRIERILDAAKAQGLREGDNPARGKGHLDLLLPKRSKIEVGHHAALPHNEVAAFMAELAGRPAVAARALEFTILTAARSGETRGMTWDEVNLEKALWTVPAARMKAGETHQVPLSASVLAVLTTVKPDDGVRDKLVFPAPRGGTMSDMTMAQLLSPHSPSAPTPTNTVQLTAADRLKPLRQGELDCFCGMYATINVVRLSAANPSEETVTCRFLTVMTDQDV